MVTGLIPSRRGTLLVASLAVPICALPVQGQNSRTPPTAPGNVQASVSAQAVVTLTWTDRSSDERGFRIVRSRQLSPSSWGEDAGFTVGPNTVTYQDRPSPGTYRYRVRSYNIRGNSSYVAASPIVVSVASLVPAMPTDLAIHDDGNGVAHLTWTDQSSNETGFEIERQPSFVSGSSQSVGPNTPSWLDQTSGGTFAYRVRALGGAGDSGYTPWLRAKILTPMNGEEVPAFPALIPGSGFSGPTPQPQPVGDPAAPGYDAKAIARWDVVPYQTFVGDFNIGVVAFDISGIDRVDFSANGGPWVSVREMQLNPQTNVTEYTARLRAADFANGSVEVRAVVWPVVGEARVLAGSMTGPGQARGEYSLPLVAAPTPGPVQERWVSPTGSDTTGTGTAQSPYRTIFRAMYSIYQAQGMDDGGKVYLMAGDHVYGDYANGMDNNTQQSWITITAAPGVDRSAVRLVNRTGRLWVRHVCISGLTVQPTSDANGMFPGSGPSIDSHLWINDCILIGPGRTVDWTWAGGWTDLFVTNCDVSACSDGFTADLQRNVVVHQIASDAFTDSGLVVNCSTSDIDQRGTTFHPDVVQWYGRSENLIVYGTNAGPNVWGQGVFGSPNAPSLTDVAVVGCTIDNQTGTTAYGYVFQFTGPTVNAYFKDSTFVGPAGWRTDMGFTAHDVVVENTHFSPGLTPSGVPGVTIRP